MRTPSQYVAASMAKLQGSLLPDCSATLRHGDEVGTVTRVGSVARGEDAVAESDIPEACRVLANPSDFPCMAKGDAVQLFDGGPGESLRVVTSATADISRSILTVGLSNPFETHGAAYRGTRRESGRVRNIAFSLNVLTLENGRAATYTEALAPTYAENYLVAIRVADWLETSDPEPSDSIDAADVRGNAPVSLKVSTVTRHDGWYILQCRTKG